MQKLISYCCTYAHTGLAMQFEQVINEVYMFIFFVHRNYLYIHKKLKMFYNNGVHITEKDNKKSFVM